MMALLLRSDYLTIITVPGLPIVRTTRTERPFPSVDVFTRAFADAVRVYELLDRNRLGLLLDFRLAPMNNDPHFELATKRVRQMVVREFAAVAFVVRTVTGVLQVDRVVRASKLPTSVPAFQSEEAATSYLLDTVNKRPDARPRRGLSPEAAPRSSSRTDKER